jgi:hypothetical protein
MQFIQDFPLVVSVSEIFGFAVTAFVLGILFTPFLTDFLFQTKLGKNIIQLRIRIDYFTVAKISV